MSKKLAFYEMPVVYQVPGMDAVQAQHDIVYKTVEETRLGLDIYSPPGMPKDAGFPGVLLVHGGPIPPNTSPLPKDWAAFASCGRLLAASGLVGVTFNYRYYSSTDLTTPGADIAAALHYVREHRKAWGLAANRLCVWIFSGAGRLLPFILHDALDWMTCLVTYYALLDLPQDKATDELLSRAFKLPIFVAKAGLDHPNINLSIDHFAQKARAAQAQVELMEHAQGHHGFDIFDDDARSREIVARTIAFIKAHV